MMSHLGRAMGLWCCMLCGLFVSLPAAAGEPTTEPLIRIEGEMHTARVRVIRYDATRNRVVTVSLDKTLRIWQLPSWRLMRVIHVPAQDINEGKLGALAISPDGGTIAVGGATGLTWDQSSSVYLFDADTGEMRSRIPGLRDIINYLAYSPDGQRLAVGLLGRGGLHVFDANTLKEVHTDLEYGAEVTYVEYSPRDATLVTSSGDGYIRVYDPEKNLIVRQPIQVSTQLGGIRVSPDGKMAIFGINDIAMAVVVSLPDLAILAKLTADDVPGQKGLCCIAWSRDGRYVFANGRYEGSGATPIYRWEVEGFKNRKTITATDQRVESMFPLADGNLIYATEDPAFGVISPSGERIRYIRSPTADFREAFRGFRVAADGTEIEFPLRRGGEVVRFSVVTQAYRRVASPAARKGRAPAAQDRLLAARRDSPRFRLEQWENEQRPLLNGKALPVYTNEFVRSYALTPDDGALLLGTDFSVRLLNEAGESLWDQKAPGTAWNVNVTADGKYAVVTYGDGSIRWHAMRDGHEVLALFPHNNGGDWVLWRPDGYYACSEQGDNYVGWLVNRGKDRAADFYKAIQFERVFYRPDLLRNLLTAAQPPQPAADAVTLSRLDEIAPPRIRVRNVSARAEDSRDVVQLEFSVEPARLPITEFGIYVNGIPVLRPADRTLSATDARGFVRQVSLPASSLGNQIRIEALNGTSLGLAETYVELPRGSEPRPPKGDLYVLAVGANRFPGLPDSPTELWQLEFASQDAVEIAASLRRNGTEMFHRVHTKVLADSESMLPTKDNILATLGWLESAGANDTVMIFLASHGMSDKAGNYYFFPRDAMAKDVAILKASTTATRGFKSLIGWQEFFNALRNVAGKRVLVVDTCTAKNAVGTFDAHSLKKRSAASSFALMVAAQGTELSQEYPAGKHGLFTYGLLRALEGSADQNRDRVITLTEAFDYSRRQVETLRYQPSPQTPALIAPWPLAETALAIPRAKPSAAKSP